MPARNIESQVEGPPKKECYRKCEDSSWWVVKVLCVPMNAGLLLWHKHLIMLRGTCVGMVAMMAMFPWKIRD